LPPSFFILDGIARALQDLRQVGTDQVAAVMYARIPLRTVSVERAISQLVNVITALTVALRTIDTEHIELALDVAE